MALHARGKNKVRRLVATAVAAAIGVTVFAAVSILSAGEAGADQVVPVLRGQSLWSIAAANGVSVSQLQQVNHLANPNLVEAGTQLTIPSAAAPPAATRHLVEPGETLIGIARQYGVTPAAIAAINKLGPSGTVYAGTMLAVPAASDAGSGSATPSSTAAPPGPGQYPSATVAAANQARAELAQTSLPSTAAVRELVAETADNLGVDPYLALAVADQESGFQQSVVSNADAIGAMQVLPSVASQLAPAVGRQLNLLNAGDNVLAGVLLLRSLTHAAPVNEAVAAYYQGLSSVRANGLFPDTQQYVRDVLALRQEFAAGKI